MLIGKSSSVCHWGRLAKLFLLFSFRVIEICSQSLILAVALYMQCQILSSYSSGSHETSEKDGSVVLATGRSMTSS